MPNESNLTKLLQDEFWQSSCQFYQQPSVKELLLSLQDLDLMQVNRILFAFWFTEKFAQIIDCNSLNLASKSLTELEKSTDLMRSKRRKLEQQWHKPYSENKQAIRNDLLEIELASEKRLQHALVRSLCQNISETKTLSSDSFFPLALRNLALLHFDKNGYNQNRIMNLISLWQQR